jgi:hypothetical protein
LRFNAACEFIEAGKPERVSVHIFKSRERSAPLGFLGWKLKANSVIAPFGELGVDIFGNEIDLRVASDEFLCRRVRHRQGKRETRAAIRRRNLDPPPTRFEAFIHHKPETKLVDVESQASFLIANEDHDEMETEIRVLPIEAQKGPVNPKR